MNERKKEKEKNELLKKTLTKVPCNRIGNVPLAIPLKNSEMRYFPLMPEKNGIRVDMLGDQ
jgi:hypothetical protein